MAQYGSPNAYRRPAGPGPVPAMKIVLLFRKDFQIQEFPFPPSAQMQSIIDLFAAFDPSGASLRRSTHSKWNPKKHCTLWETKLTAAHLGCFTVTEETKEGSKTGAHRMLYERLYSIARLITTVEKIYTAAGSCLDNLSSYLTYRIFRDELEQNLFPKSVFNSEVTDLVTLGLPLAERISQFTYDSPKKVSMTVIYFPRFEAVGDNYEDAFVRCFETMIRGVLKVKEEARLEMERLESNRILEKVLAELKIKDEDGGPKEEEGVTGPE